MTSNRVAAAMRRAAESLRQQGVRFALVGGLAVSARSDPRFTRDVDFAVAVEDDAGAEAVVHGLLRSGYVLRATVEQEATGRLATVRLQPPGEDATGVVTDLLFASSGIEPELVARAEPLEIVPGLSLPVASSSDLIALKVLAASAARPQDAADLRALAASATAADLDAARASLRLIARRGFARGKDLLAELEALLR